MNDLLPDVIELWQHVEAAARDILHAYGYREIRAPLVEKTELFARSIGHVTDIVEKEMYSFEDRSGDSLTLRPEGTAGCVRAAIENGLLHNQVQRFWYAGPMFRHERPQKGRYRQFHQIGVEAFGMQGPDIDAELILMSCRLWEALGLRELTLEINSLGTPESRARYRKVLIDYFTEYRDQLDADSLRRLEHNPLRILDSKNAAMRDIINRAPNMFDYLDDDARAHFEELQRYLNEAQVSYTVNPRLVRGLDYYTHAVFEWTTDKLGAQSAICAGGRFDGLVEQLGGKPTPAAGFAIGMERLTGLVSLVGLPEIDSAPHVYMALLGGLAEHRGMGLAETLRSSGLRVLCNCGGGSMKSQMKRADKSAARFALILGDEECAQGKVTFKNLRISGPQELIDQSSVVEHIQKRLQ